MRTRRDDDGGVDETRRLLDRAEALGLEIKDIAEILQVSKQRVSDYRKHVREGGPAMPRNNRQVLKVVLDRKEEEVSTSRSRLYPSQQTALEHDNVEYLARLTGARGPIWTAYQETVRAFRKAGEEQYGKGGAGQNGDGAGSQPQPSGGTPNTSDA